MSHAHGFGIIGCGMIAEFHTRAINEIEGARVVAAWSRNPANGAKIAAMAERGLRGLRRPGRDAGATGAGRGLRLHAQRRPHGAGGQGRAGGQARGRREAAGDHPAALRRDHRGLRRGRRPALHDLPLAVLGRQHPAQGSDRDRPVRPADARRYLREVVADPAILRLGRLAGHLGPRRRRRPDEPGDPQRRPALLADGRRRRDHGDDRHAGPRADRGRGHGGRRLAVQERGPGHDRGGHERLSGPA